VPFSVNHLREGILSIISSIKRRISKKRKKQVKAFVKRSFHIIGLDVRRYKPTSQSGLLSSAIQSISKQFSYGPTVDVSKLDDISKLMYDAMSDGRLRDDVTDVTDISTEFVSHMLAHSCPIQTAFSDNSTVNHIAFKYRDRKMIFDAARSFNFNGIRVRFAPTRNENEHRKTHLFYFHDELRSYTSKLFCLDPWLQDHERVYSNTKNTFCSSIDKRHVNRTTYSPHPYFFAGEPENSSISLSEMFSVQEGIQHVVPFPIDAVYTWVDGADPAWVNKKRSYLTHTFGDPESVSDSRYRSSEELRFSLRSIVANAPFIRNIYIVTDGQIPPHIDFSHPRINLVDHKDILDPEHLPTFNSHAIEANLHKIPGLSEHFLYLNDDFFFWSKCLAKDFFHANGLTKSFLEKLPNVAGEVMSDTPVWRAAAINSNQLLKREFGRTLNIHHLHTPYSLRKTVLEEIWSKFPDELDRTSRTRFRSNTDISPTSFLYHGYSYASGRSTFDHISSERLGIGREKFQDELSRILLDFKTKVLCINDGDGIHSDIDRSFMQFGLTKRFSVAAPWES